MNTAETSKHLAALHQASFVDQRPWSAAEFANLLSTSHCHVVSEPDGFGLIRVVGDEAELLTLAVHPDHRRSGLGRRILVEITAKAVAAGAAELFLEVAADNTAALVLYQNAGFQKVATRSQYYARTDGNAADAVVMSRALP